MAFDDYKILDSDSGYQNVQNQEGDALTGTVSSNKQVFDAYPDLIASKYNNLLDNMESEMQLSFSDSLVKTALLNIFYPVGSYYETSKSTQEFNPNTAWGGTWSLETSGQVHVSAGTGYSLGATGGSKDAIVVSHDHTATHNISTASTGAHTHTVTGTTTSNKHSHSKSESSVTCGNASLTHTHTLQSGGGIMGYTGDMERQKVQAYGQTSSSGNKFVFTSANLSDLVYGGSNTSTESRSHAHSITVGFSDSGAHTHTLASGSAASNGAHTHTVNGSVTVATKGSSGTNANMQPYIVVNRWHRTA